MTRTDEGRTVVGRTHLAGSPQAQGPTKPVEVQGHWSQHGGRTLARTYGRSVPENTCQASRDLATRLSSMYTRSPYR